ncbi:hypothetical protein GCM10009092_24840 [Bowmanella denitrificans]|uniref:Uncharacterized protein n=1 Tax=Bowmanella denitrificans TaxID=366582 RepID=A0ABN0XAW2_9ALTE
MHSTKPGQGTAKTLHWPAQACKSDWNLLLSNVAWVASRPILPLLLAKAAGLIAGSIPMTGKGLVALKVSIQMAVAELQATTMALQD